MIRVEHLSRVGEALKELRWRARMKQVEVCRATGVTAPQVSRYENGHEMPTLESLVKYLSAVGAGLGDLERLLVGLAPRADEAAPEVSPPEVPPPAVPPAAAPEPEDVADPVLAYRVGLEDIRRDDARRLLERPALRSMVGSLVELNVEGMERLEERLRSVERLEERLQSMEEGMRDLREALEVRRAG